MNKRHLLYSTVFFLFLSACSTQTSPEDPPDQAAVNNLTPVDTVDHRTFFHVNHDVRIRGYFEFMDSLVTHLDTTLSYPVNEYILVRANPWIIDTLMSTDYYRMMAERDSFVYDPNALIVLHRGDSLLIPDSLMMDSLRFSLATAVIDVNIPEYTLRIFERGKEVFRCPVRVGRNERKYLAMAGRRVDLRTYPGVGVIARINRNPIFINPSNNHRYEVTRRDDNRVTLLPRIPWLETEIDGQRLGQLIHPTTNPETLGRAYSNGCIGTGEASAWRIYYSAPLGTRVVIRYDLTVVDEKGDTTRLKDIYPGFERLSPSRHPETEIVALAWSPHQFLSNCSPDCITVWEADSREFEEAR